MPREEKQGRIVVRRVNALIKQRVFGFRVLRAVDGGLEGPTAAVSGRQLLHRRHAAPQGRELRCSQGVDIGADAEARVGTNRIRADGLAAGSSQPASQGGIGGGTDADGCR
jgi:hypothetical protein